jgi:ABC-type multidrug transport system fused ATPase/permease subunit
MQTEARILEDVLAAYRDRSVVFVTHRVGMARLADQVCVLEHGRLAGVGTHDGLLLECETYRALHGGKPARAS